MWDLFGDGWNNLQLTAKSFDGSFVSNYQMDFSCGKSVQFCVRLDLDYLITIEPIDQSKPVRFGWEAFFKFVHPFTGRAYYGQEGTIIRINNTHVISTDNLVNINPEAEVNECRECPHPVKNHHRMLTNSSLSPPSREVREPKNAHLLSFHLVFEIMFGMVVKITQQRKSVMEQIKLIPKCLLSSFILDISSSILNAQTSFIRDQFAEHCPEEILKLAKKFFPMMVNFFFVLQDLKSMMNLRSNGISVESRVN